MVKCMPIFPFVHALSPKNFKITSPKQNLYIFKLHTNPNKAKNNEIVPIPIFRLSKIFSPFD